MDIKTDSATGDIDDSTNSLELVDGIEAIAQDLTSRLKTFRGEYFLDQNVGIPFYRDFFVKNPNLRVLNSVIRSAVLSTPGIKEIVSLEIDFNTSERRLTVNLEGRIYESVIDDTFVYVFNDVIIGDA
jgi:hypothetical protein